MVKRLRFRAMSIDDARTPTPRTPMRVTMKSKEMQLFLLTIHTQKCVNDEHVELDNSLILLYYLTGRVDGEHSRNRTWFLYNLVIIRGVNNTH